MDFLVDAGREDAVYPEIWRRLCAEDWTELELWGLLASSQTRGRILSLAKEAGYGVSRWSKRWRPASTCRRPGTSTSRR